MRVTKILKLIHFFLKILLGLIFVSMNIICGSLQGESKKSITFSVIFNEKWVLYFGKVISEKFP